MRTDVTDETLIERALAGDSDALEALLARHERNIYHIALRTLGHREDALDMAQEAVIKIVRSIRGFKKDSTFKVWAYRITVNTCLDELRKRKKRKQVSLDAFLETGSELPDPNETPEASALRHDLKATLEREIAKLPEEYRAALVLRDLTGLSYQEVAEALDISLGTVKSRINRARNILKDRLPAQLEEDE